MNGISVPPDVIIGVKKCILCQNAWGKKLHLRLYFIFMDDNAGPHRAHVVHQFVERNGIERMEWPARSPDCNPIENLWGIIKRKASKKVKDDTSLQEFQRILQRAWANTEQRQVQTLVNSMRKRCRLVIEADGGHINY